MSDSREEGALALVVIGGGLLGLAWVVWSFSEALNLDMRTGGRVLGALILAAGFMVAAWWPWWLVGTG